jgi:hypothetical protein
MLVNDQALYVWQAKVGQAKATESGAENIPPLSFGSKVRVKWRGKSSPQDWRQDWQAKPHPEQHQIGMRAGQLAEIGSTEHAGRWLERRSNVSPRGMFVKARKGFTESGL